MEVAFFAKELCELLVSHDARLREAVHASTDFDVCVAVVYEVEDIVLVNYFLWDLVDGNAHVFVFGGIFHWCAEVEVFNVHASGFGIVGGDDGVEDKLGGGYIGGACAFVAVEVDEIASDGKARTIWFSLLRTYRANETGVGWAFVVTDCGVFNEVAGVGTSDTTANTLEKATKFVGA